MSFPFVFFILMYGFYVFFYLNYTKKETGKYIAEVQSLGEAHTRKEDPIILETYRILQEYQAKMRKKRFKIISLSFLSVVIVSVISSFFGGIEGSIIGFVFTLWIVSSLIVVYLVNLHKIEGRIEKILSAKSKI